MPLPEHGGGTSKTTPTSRKRHACSTWPVCRRNGPRSRPRATTNGRSWKKMPPATAVPGSARQGKSDRGSPAAVSSKALEALGYDRKTAEDPNKLAALAKKSDSKTEALVAWIKKNLFVRRQAAGRRAADRLHRVQGDAVLPGAAAPPGRLRQEHAAAAVRRHGPGRIRGGQVRV